MKSLEVAFGLELASARGSRSRLLNMLAVLTITATSKAFAAPAHLRTNPLTAPIAVASQILLSWQRNSTALGWRQTAYEIVVSTGQSFLPPRKPDVADSEGKVSSWVPAKFETDLLFRSDWKPDWINRSDPAADTEINTVRGIGLTGVGTQQVPLASPAHFLYRLHLGDKPRNASLYLLAAAMFSAFETHYTIAGSTLNLPIAPLALRGMFL